MMMHHDTSAVECGAPSNHGLPLRLGITGGIGSGKSYVAHLLAERWHVPVYDCDAEAKRLTAQSDDIRQKLCRLVGPELWQDGCMQKAMLAQYLFSSEENAARVNAIIHPVVNADFLQWASRQTCQLVAMESAILYESGFNTLVDHTILVDAPHDVCLHRAMKRDGACQTQIEARMARQRTSLARQHAGFVLVNDGRSEEALMEQLQSVIDALLAD